MQTRGRAQLGWRVGVCALVLLDLAVAGGTLAIRARDRATPVTIDAALDRFRRAEVPPDPDETPAPSTAAGPTAEPGSAAADATVAEPATTPAAAASPVRATTTTDGRRLPAPGVYVYDTVGWEETDALGGARHEYPSTSTVTVRTGGCGVVARWDVLEDRSDEFERCLAPQGGEHLAGFVARHGFYGQKDERTFRCEPGSLYRPPSGTPVGSSWTYQCRSETTVDTSTVTLVGYETLDVGGVVVPAVHVQELGEPSGDTSGSMRRDLWFAVDDGLLLRERTAVESDSKKGAIQASYREQYEIRLTSVHPRR